MIRRWVVTYHAHRGWYRRLSVRRAQRHGDVVIDGGVEGTLKRCPECGGTGFLHHPTVMPPKVAPR